MKSENNTNASNSVGIEMTRGNRSRRKTDLQGSFFGHVSAQSEDPIRLKETIVRQREWPAKQNSSVKNGVINTAPDSIQDHGFRKQDNTVSSHMRTESESSNCNFNEVYGTHVNSDSSNQNRQNKRVIIVAVVAFLIICVFSWCGINRARGMRAYNSAEYSLAYDFLKRDFIFSKGQAQAALYMSGKDKYNHRQYEEAAAIFLEVGESAYEDWVNSIYNLAKEKSAAGDYDGAIILLHSISNDSRARSLNSEILSRVASELLESGDYEGALAAADGIADASQASSLTEEVYFTKGISAIMEGNVEEAIDSLQNCSSKEAQDYVSLLRLVSSGNLYSAAQEALVAVQKYPDGVRQYFWETIITDAADSLNQSNIDSRLLAESAKAIIREYRSSINEGITADDLSGWDIGIVIGSSVIGSIDPSDNMIAFSSLSDLYSKCGTNPSGKVLVVRHQYDYPDHNEYCAVDFNIMRYLPKELYPQSLSAVEYVVVVTYDYSKTGTYRVTNTYTWTSGDTTQSSYDVVGLQIKARVETVMLPSQRAVYTSQTIVGESSPSLLGGTTDWKCGDPPALGEYIIKAVSSVT